MGAVHLTFVQVPQALMSVLVMAQYVDTVPVHVLQVLQPTVGSGALSNGEL